MRLSFYDRLAQGLGDHFLETLYAEIDTLLVYAGVHIKVFGYHRMLSRRFPFAIYYFLEEENIIIMAVLDCRRDPASIARRLTNDDDTRQS